MELASWGGKGSSSEGRQPGDEHGTCRQAGWEGKGRETEPRRQRWKQQRRKLGREGRLSSVRRRHGGSVHCIGHGGPLTSRHEVRLLLPGWLAGPSTPTMATPPPFSLHKVYICGSGMG